MAMIKGLEVESLALRLLADMPNEERAKPELSRALWLHDQINLSYGLKIKLLSAVDLLSEFQG